ncbi:MAG: hypothetical protein H6908_04920 [Hyphomicrobiales bacterium]|nr:hypothetical protein [Hyphomicrobiales bacterium]
MNRKPSSYLLLIRMRAGNVTLLIVFLGLFFAHAVQAQNFAPNQCPNPAIVMLPEGYASDCGSGKFGKEWDWDIVLGIGNLVSNPNGKPAIAAKEYDQAGAPSLHDIWPTHTGCYNPEDRFLEKVITDESTGTFVMIPDDKQLVVNPKCRHVYGAGDQFLEITPEDPISGTKGKVTGFDPDRAYRSQDQQNILCMTDDYIDDVDDFCAHFLPEFMLPSVRLNAPNPQLQALFGMSGAVLSTPGIANPFFPGYQKYITVPQADLPRYQQFFGTNLNEVCASGLCRFKIAAVQPINPTDHYLPPALLEELDPQMCGAYGFNEHRITSAAVNPKSYNPLNIYNLDPDDIRAPSDPDLGLNVGDPVPIEHLLDPDNWGQKLKKLQCLRLYITEWAHRADCGEILLPGRRSDITEGHCQMVSIYNASGFPMEFSQATDLESLLSAAMDLGTYTEITGYQWPGREGELFGTSSGTVPGTDCGVNKCPGIPCDAGDTCVGNNYCEKSDGTQYCPVISSSSSSSSGAFICGDTLPSGEACKCDGGCCTSNAECDDGDPNNGTEICEPDGSCSRVGYAAPFSCTNFCPAGGSRCQARVPVCHANNASQCAYGLPGSPISQCPGNGPMTGVGAGGCPLVGEWSCDFNGALCEWSAELFDSGGCIGGANGGTYCPTGLEC